MSYQHSSYAAWFGTAEGAKVLGKALENVETVLDPAGCALMSKLAPWGEACDSWKAMAAVDHLVLMGTLREAEYPPGRTPAGQDRIFLRNRGSA